MSGIPSTQIKRTSIGMMSRFIATAKPPVDARARAAVALCDTLGVILAGAVEPVAKLVREHVREEGSGDCRIFGVSQTAGPGNAALANGVAAHALDYDDMCFVSMAHPSCALVPAIFAAGEIAGASGRAILEGYIVGFEIECRLGAVMNPRHYHSRGWHCTSSIGTVGAAAAAARVLGLSPTAAAHALGIAASSACGLKQNFGTMVKPLHAGIAARNGLMAARLARTGFDSSEEAFDGPQGYLVAMDSDRPASALEEAVSDLGSRWEINETGITVKLYPSCAATHPPLDALLSLVRQYRFAADDVTAIEFEVDSMTPRLLIYERPATDLEAKFSLPFCAAAAIIFGPPSIDTFEVTRIQDARVQSLIPRVSMRVNASFDAAAPLSQARVTVHLRDGRKLEAAADGARGYPGRLSEEELAEKFLACARRSVSGASAAGLLEAIRNVENMASIRALMPLGVAK